MQVQPIPIIEPESPAVLLRILHRHGPAPGRRDLVGLGHGRHRLGELLWRHLVRVRRLPVQGWSRVDHAPIRSHDVQDAGFLVRDHERLPIVRLDRHDPVGHQRGLGRYLGAAKVSLGLLDQGLHDDRLRPGRDRHRLGVLDVVDVQRNRHTRQQHHELPERYSQLRRDGLQPRLDLLALALGPGCRLGLQLLAADRVVDLLLPIRKQAVPRLVHRLAAGLGGFGLGFEQRLGVCQVPRRPNLDDGAYPRLLDVGIEQRLSVANVLLADAVATLGMDERPGRLSVVARRDFARYPAALVRSALLRRSHRLECAVLRVDHARELPTALRRILVGADLDAVVDSVRRLHSYHHAADRVRPVLQWVFIGRRENNMVAFLRRGFRRSSLGGLLHLVGRSA